MKIGQPIGAKRLFPLVLAGAFLLPVAAGAAETAEATPLNVTDTLWVLIAAFMVFIMNAGFAFLEAGFCQSKNIVNILAKNFSVFAIAALSYWAIGYALMFGEGNSFIGYSGFLYNDMGVSEGGLSNFAFFFFQMAFVAAGCSIISGAVAERIKYGAYLLFGLLFVTLLYPVTGHWTWGGGFLGNFHDFAGSTIVHSVGGWAALAGILVLGPREGKYKANGQVQPIPAHSFPLAVLGGFLLWFGWYGFNPGSELALDDAVPRIVVTTTLAAVAGIATSTMVAWMKFGKPDLSMIINGCLAGLVAITAPCAVVSPAGAVIIGAIAGVLVVFSVLFFDKIKIDDPVGALSVHLVNGIWGTLAVGIFGVTEYGVTAGGAQLVHQIVGILAIGGYTFVGSLILWMVVKVVMGGIRVSSEEEQLGLDLGEMGVEGYNIDPA